MRCAAWSAPGWRGGVATRGHHCWLWGVFLFEGIQEKLKEIWAVGLSFFEGTHFEAALRKLL